MIQLERKLHIKTYTMKDEARQFIKSELAKRDINYVKLSEYMNKKGYKENPDSIRTKIHRGSFSFAFVLEVCDSLGLEFSISNLSE
jgi:hypothetical protein